MKKLRFDNRNIQRIIVKISKMNVLKGQLRRKVTKFKKKETKF